MHSLNGIANKTSWHYQEWHIVIYYRSLTIKGIGLDLHMCLACLQLYIIYLVILKNY